MITHYRDRDGTRVALVNRDRIAGPCHYLCQQLLEACTVYRSLKVRPALLEATLLGERLMMARGPELLIYSAPLDLLRGGSKLEHLAQQVKELGREATIYRVLGVRQ